MIGFQWLLHLEYHPRPLEPLPVNCDLSLLCNPRDYCLMSGPVREGPLFSNIKRAIAEIILAGLLFRRPKNHHVLLTTVQQLYQAIHLLSPRICRLYAELLAGDRGRLAARFFFCLALDALNSSFCSVDQCSGYPYR